MRRAASGIAARAGARVDGRDVSAALAFAVSPAPRLDEPVRRVVVEALEARLAAEASGSSSARASRSKSCWCRNCACEAVAAAASAATAIAAANESPETIPKRLFGERMATASSGLDRTVKS